MTSFVNTTLTLTWPTGHICPTYKESFQVRWDNSIPLFSMLPSTLKYLYSVEPVRMHFPAKQPCTNDTVCNAACSIAHRFSISHRSCRQPKTYVKPKAAVTVFELLMMGGVSPETCWAIKKHWNNKFYYTVASCWFLLWDLYYDVRIHKHQVEPAESFSKITLPLS